MEKTTFQSLYNVCEPFEILELYWTVFPVGGRRGIPDTGAEEDREQKEGAREEGPGPAETHQSCWHHHRVKAGGEKGFQEKAPTKKRNGKTGMMCTITKEEKWKCLML